MSGGGGSSTTTATQVNYSPEEAARRTALQDIGLSTYNQQTAGGTPPYPGAAPVGASDQTIYGQRGLTDAAANMMARNVPNMNAALNYGLNLPFYENGDPTLNAAISAAVRPISQAYTDPGGYFAQNRADMIGSNMLGSSRDAIANAVLGGRMATAMGDTAAKIAEASRADTLNTFSKTMAMTPELLAANTLPAQWQSAVGSQQEQYAQQQQDYDAATRAWQLNYPWLQLQNLAGIIYGGSSPGTTSTGSGTTPRPSPLQTAATIGTTGVAAATLWDWLASAASTAAVAA